VLDEDAPLRVGPPDDYGRSKAAGERAVRDAGGRGLRHVILRPTAVLSMHPRSYWGPLAVARARSEPGPIVRLAVLPHVHVDNLAEAVLLAATREGALGRAYDVVDGHGPVDEYLAALYAAAGRPVPALAGRRPVVRYRGERIRAELGYAPVDRWPEFIAELAAYRAP
jgi:nucleoside-diphosphate-sugar epimerase